MKKRMIKVFVPIVCAILLELLVFNFAPLHTVLRGEKAVKFSIQELSFVNWEERDDMYVSLPDPMIIKDNLSMMADTVTIRLTSEPQPSNYTIFYTTGANESFSTERMLVETGMTGDDTISLGQRIWALRIDPTEEAGVVLKDAELSFNDVRWDVSISRIVAMLIVWWGTNALMKFQGVPDYRLENAEERSDDT